MNLLMRSSSAMSRTLGSNTAPESYTEGVGGGGGGGMT